ARKLGQSLPSRLPETTGDPVVDGYTKALFLPVQDVMRQLRTHRVFQDRFEPSISHARGCGDGHRPFDQVMVEEWNAGFDAHAHAHLVHTHEEELGQSNLQVEIGHPPTLVRSCRRSLELLVEGPYDFPRGIVPRASDGRTQKHLLVGFRKRIRTSPEK